MYRRHVSLQLRKFLSLGVLVIAVVSVALPGLGHLLAHGHAQTCHAGCDGLLAQADPHDCCEETSSHARGHSPTGCKAESNGCHDTGCHDTRCLDVRCFDHESASGSDPHSHQPPSCPGPEECEFDAVSETLWVRVNVDDSPTLDSTIEETPCLANMDRRLHAHPSLRPATAMSPPLRSAQTPVTLSSILLL